MLCPPVVTHHLYPGYIIATTLWGRSLCLYNTVSNTVTQIEDASFVGDVTSLVMSPDGSKLAVGGSSGLVVLFPVVCNLNHTPFISQQQSEFVVLRGQESAVTAIAFDGNNIACATGGQDGRVCVHFLDTGRIVSSFNEPVAKDKQRPHRSVLSLAFTRQSDVVVVRENAESAWIYSPNGRLVEQLSLEGRQPLQVFVLFDEVGQNDQIVVVDRDGLTFITVRLFSLPRARRYRRWPLPQPCGSYWIRFVTSWMQPQPQADGESQTSSSQTLPPVPFLRRHARSKQQQPTQLLLYCESYSALRLTQPVSIIVSLTITFP